MNEIESIRWAYGIAFAFVRLDAGWWVLEHEDTDTVIALKWDVRCYTWAMFVNGEKVWYFSATSLEEAFVGAIREMVSTLLQTKAVEREKIEEWYRSNLATHVLFDLTSVRKNGMPHTLGAWKVLEEEGLIEPDGSGWYDLTEAGWEVLELRVVYPQRR